MKKRIISFLCGITVSVACVANVINVSTIIQNESTQIVADASTDVPYYNWKQSDSQWGSLKLGSSGCTVSGYGCTATSVAMLIAHSGQMDGKDFDPGVFVTWMSNNGGFDKTGCLIWSVSSKLCNNFKFQQKTTVSGTNANKLKQIKQYYDQGYYMVVSVTSKVSGRANGHWVAIRYVDDEHAVIMDPGGYYTDLFDYTGINYVSLYTSATPANQIPYVDEEEEEIEVEPEVVSIFEDKSPVDIGNDVYAYTGIKSSEDSDELLYLTNYYGQLYFQDFNPFDEKQIWHFKKNYDDTYSVFTYLDDGVSALTYNGDSQTLEVQSYNALYTQRFNLYYIDGYFYLNPVYTDYALSIGEHKQITTDSENSSLKLAVANILGDVNQDYTVDYKDLLTVKKYILGLSSDISALADVNQDGTVNFLDYIQLNHQIMG